MRLKSGKFLVNFLFYCQPKATVNPIFRDFENNFLSSSYQLFPEIVPFVTTGK